MAYTSTVWEVGDILTSTGLNEIEAELEHVSEAADDLVLLTGRVFSLEEAFADSEIEKEAIEKKLNQQNTLLLNQNKIINNIKASLDELKLVVDGLKVDVEDLKGGQ